MNLKITPVDYEYMKLAIGHSLVRDQDFWNERRRLVSAKRFRWDVMRSAGLIPWSCDVLYKYMTDDHIDSALKRVMSEFDFKEIA